jgi:hypothetical protein
LVAGAGAGAWACTAGTANIASAAATVVTSDQRTGRAGAHTIRMVILNPLSRRFRLQARRSEDPLEIEVSTANEAAK